MHSALRLMIEHLKLRSNRNCVEFLTSNPLISPTQAKLELVILWFQTYGTSLKIEKRAGVYDA